MRVVWFNFLRLVGLKCVPAMNEFCSQRFVLHRLLYTALHQPQLRRALSYVWLVITPLHLCFSFFFSSGKKLSHLAFLFFYWLFSPYVHGWKIAYDLLNARDLKTFWLLHRAAYMTKRIGVKPMVQSMFFVCCSIFTCIHESTHRRSEKQWKPQTHFLLAFFSLLDM